MLASTHWQHRDIAWAHDIRGRVGSACPVWSPILTEPWVASAHWAVWEGQHVPQPKGQKAQEEPACGEPSTGQGRTAPLLRSPASPVPMARTHRAVPSAFTVHLVPSLTQTHRASLKIKPKLKIKCLKSHPARPRLGLGTHSGSGECWAWVQGSWARHPLTRRPQACSHGWPARALSGCRLEKRPRAQMGKTFL